MQKTRRAVPALMIQGLSSDSGKSVLAAAFCRLLTRRGLRTRPFKAQNMSNNSFVALGEGSSAALDRPLPGEMGRAQAVQALACRVAPDARMNPVLLKPVSDFGSQVVVLGRATETLKARDYYQRKPQLFDAVRTAYDALSAEAQVMVIEGAGSPAEINLAKHDIVNMRMAEYAKAKVVLVGDIDRGGVFAGFVGTLALLPPAHRRLVSGLIVNKFRGDASLLADALDATTKRTKKPFLGVAPFIPDLGLPEEDSVAFKAGTVFAGASASGPGLDLVLLDLPHIANFTDFEPFLRTPGVGLRLVRPADGPDALQGSDGRGDPDALFLPGTKNTLADLDALRAAGFAEALGELAARGRTEIVGVCGGLQMLGQTLADPHRLESELGSIPGLGLMALETTLLPNKTLARTGARFADGASTSGYEIHHGVTRPLDKSAIPVMFREDGKALGWGTASGRVWGTYLHGLFDDDGFRRAFLRKLAARRGLSGDFDASYDVDAALDRLADVVEAHVSMNVIYSLLGV